MSSENQILIIVTSVEVEGKDPRDLQNNFEQKIKESGMIPLEDLSVFFASTPQTSSDDIEDDNGGTISAEIRVGYDALGIDEDADEDVIDENSRDFIEKLTSKTGLELTVDDVIQIQD